ncbi:MAG: hypothetical protein K9G46_09220 [Flavobacteriales bacterium]|nr:hypothetical protein [Flavobacteriales bacterium]
MGKLLVRNIRALDIDKPVYFEKKSPEVRAVKYDLKIVPFVDKAFDICLSNAVIVKRN